MGMSLHLAHLRVDLANWVGAQRPLGSRVATPMRVLVFAMVVASVAHAEPRVALRVDDPGFVWRAPDGCPDAATVRTRTEQRLGGPLDGLHGIEIDITHERTGFVARIDARAITVANDIRTLKSRRCDALGDAVAVVLARLATEARLSRASGPAAGSRGDLGSTPPLDTTVGMAPTSTAALDTVEHDIEHDMSDQHIADEEPARPRARRWGGGVQLLGLSGVGALPQINLGAELSGFVRRGQRFASLGVSRWVPQSARVAPGAPGGVEVKLDTLVVRAGWAPSAVPVRAWIVGEVGQIQGTGVYLDTERTGGALWIALGAGVGVGWPMSPRARLVGTFEVAIPQERPRFMLAAGSDLYQPAPAAARCALGLEVGWP